MFCAVSFKFVDHGRRRGNTAQAIDRWQHPVAYSEAMDVLHRAMCPALYRRICMTIEIASDSPTFFVVADSLLLTTRTIKHRKSYFKLKPSYIIVLIVVINLIVCLWRPQSMMDAVSVTICNGGRAIRQKYE